MSMYLFVHCCWGLLAGWLAEFVRQAGWQAVGGGQGGTDGRAVTASLLSGGTAQEKERDSAADWLFVDLFLSVLRMCVFG